MNENVSTTCRSTRRHVVRYFVAIAALLWLAMPALAQTSADRPPATAAGHRVEDKIDAFLGEPKLDMQQVFQGERFPNVVVGVDGTVLATWGSSSVRVRRSEDAGQTWGETITIAKPGFQGGGLTVDETTGHILAFVEAHHPPAEVSVYRSTDQGKSWKREDAQTERI